MQSVYIVAAKRTPIGGLNKSLAGLSAAQLGSRVIAGVLESAALDPAQVDEVVMGQVLTAGAGMNPARQAARAAGIPDERTAFLVNQVCGSGLRAVCLGWQQILCGDAEVVVAGGQESMSNAPHLAFVRSGHKLGDMQLRDSVMQDGLTDAFYGYPMGETAEKLASLHSLDRAAQDAFALESQLRASRAARAGLFQDQVVPLTLANKVMNEDESIRHEQTLDALAGLRPAFRSDGTVTAGNASGINDGAAALLVMSEAALQRSKAQPLARLVSWATAGVEPSVMGLGPVPASRRALQKAGWTQDDIDLWEINEAFAAQTLSVIKELALDPARVNVHGGAIALGHPIGASGARILVTLLHALKHRKARRGLATLCIGGGMGIALCVERV